MAQLLRKAANRNKPWVSADLDLLLPQSGYEIVPPPPEIVQKMEKSLQDRAALGDTPIHVGQTPLNETPLPSSMNMEPDHIHQGDQIDPLVTLTMMDDIDENGDPNDPDVKRKRLLTLLIAIKKGNPLERKLALKRISKYVVYFGKECIFEILLPIIEQQFLDPVERHYMLKVLDRVIFALGKSILGKKGHNYVPPILDATLGLLNDPLHIARQEGKELICNLGKAVGLKPIILGLMDRIKSVETDDRFLSARALAAVSSSLGIQQLFPFLVVCSKSDNWRINHTCILTIDFIAKSVGMGILASLTTSLSLLKPFFEKNIANREIKRASCNAISSLADAVHPHGINKFEPLLPALWGKLNTDNQNQFAYLRSLSSILTLMSEDNAKVYAPKLLPFLKTQFDFRNSSLRNAGIKVLKHMVTTPGVEAELISKELFPLFMKTFWSRDSALDSSLCHKIVSAFESFACILDFELLVARPTQGPNVLLGLKDNAKPVRILSMRIIRMLLKRYKLTEILQHSPETVQDMIIRLNDAMVFAYKQHTDLSYIQESTGDRKNHQVFIMLHGLGEWIQFLGPHSQLLFKSYFDMIFLHLRSPNPIIREQAADLVAVSAQPIKKFLADKLPQLVQGLFGKIDKIEFPDELGSCLGAINALTLANGTQNLMTINSVGDLLMKLTPILGNRHEKVQLECIRLVGTIADLGAENVNDREWTRICFELLELLKARKRDIRRVAIKTFGSIALAVGPLQVLDPLLDNLKVQNRTSRIASTIAISVVADRCGPFSVLPALLNEYRVPEIHVQHGVLKSLGFLFETIGKQSSQYLCSVTTLIDDALTERDVVHRQMGTVVLRHLALGCYGSGQEDIFIHLLNSLWPNILEPHPHMARAVVETIEAIALTVGPLTILNYLLGGLFHPAQKVRKAYWRVHNALYAMFADQLVAGYPQISIDLGMDPLSQYALKSRAIEKDTNTTSFQSIADRLSHHGEIKFDPTQPQMNRYYRSELDLIF